MTTPTARPYAGPRWVGAAGSTLVTVGGWTAGALPVDSPVPGALGAAASSGHLVTAGLVLVWAGVALLSCAWLALAGRALRGELQTRGMAVCLLWWAVPLLVCAPVFSRDAWSYLAQGAMSGAGISPYDLGPASNPGVFTDQVSPDWRTTPAPYGPVHVAVTQAITAVVGPHPVAGILVLRAVTLAAYAGLCAAVVSLARRVGLDPGTALWWSAAPLLVVHLEGGLHNETLPLALTVAAFAAAAGRRVLLAALSVGVAMAVKITAAVAAPFLVWVVLDRTREWSARRRVGAVAAVVVVPPALTVALSVLGPGLGWISGLAVSDRVINYLSVPTGAAHLAAAVLGDSGPGFDALVPHTRAAGRILLAVLLVALWVWRRRSTRAALQGVTVALGAFCVLNSVSWPWYFCWVVALWPFARFGRRADAAAVGAIVFLVLALGPNGSTSLYTPVVPLVGLALGLAAAVGVYRAGPAGATSTTGSTGPAGATGAGVRTPSPAPDA